MKEFLLSNIDAVIVTALGLYFTVYAILKREALASSSFAAARQLPKLAPVLLLFGIVLFVLPKEQEPEEEQSSWVAVELDDGVARAEFPEAPTSDEVLTPVGDFTIRRLTHVLDLAEGKINMRFSFSQHLPGAEGFTDEQRLAEIRGTFLQRGFEIEHDSIDEEGYHNLALFHGQKNARVVMKMVFTPKGTYRVIGTTMAGHFRDDRIERFLESFAMKKP